LKDVEIAHFERVDFALKNFDIVFVFKDFTKEPLRISTVPREHLDTLQAFLNWKNVLYFQGKHNLDWKEILNTIRDNLGDFIQRGGWSFLQEEEDGGRPRRVHEGGDNSDEERRMSGSEYVPTDNENASEDLDEEENEEENDDDYNDDYEESEEVDDEGDDDGDLNNDNNHNDDNEDEAPSWEELEKKANEEDRKARMRERNRDFVDTRPSNHDNKRRRF